MFARPAAVAAALGLETGPLAEGQQRVEMWVGDQIDVAAASAVAAIGPAAWDVRLTAECRRAIAAVAGLEEYSSAIVEFTSHNQVCAVARFVLSLPSHAEGCKAGGKNP